MEEEEDRQVNAKSKQVNKMGGGGVLVQVTKNNFVWMYKFKTMKNYYMKSNIAKVL